RWARWLVDGSSTAAVAVATWGFRTLGRNRYQAFQVLRRALLLVLLVTLVGLYRLAPWEATAVMVVALLALGVVAAEKVRPEQAGEGAAHRAGRYHVARGDAAPGGGSAWCCARCDATHRGVAEYGRGPNLRYPRSGSFASQTGCGAVW